MGGTPQLLRVTIMRHCPSVFWPFFGVGFRSCLRSGAARPRIRRRATAGGLEDENGIAHANDWAAGFLRGMELRKKDWADLLNDEQHGGWLVPIFALAHEHSLDAVMRPYKEPVSPERREQLIAGAAAGLRGIYRHFQAKRLHENLLGSTTIRRMTPKVGRNDPCPCGSGKKFKQSLASSPRWRAGGARIDRSLS
jgi:Uncharacterised protein family (UPF0149)/SEC-C motif